MFHVGKQEQKTTDLQAKDLSTRKAIMQLLFLIWMGIILSVFIISLGG